MERRSFLKFSAAMVAGAATTSPLQALAASNSQLANKATAHPGASPANVPSDLSPYIGIWGETQVRHLLRRTMFGVPITQLAAAVSLGSMSAVVSALLDTSAPLPSAPGSWVDEYLAPDPTISDPKLAALDVNNKANQEAARSQQIKNWWLDLMLQTNLNFREKMAFMWSNHFVVGTNVVKHAGYLYQYTQTLRQYALGNLRDFVQAIATDPAMLLYLNGNQNYWGEDPSGNQVGDHVNENFAREVMELFTIGLTDPKTGNPNYTQNDVEAAAQALSGWQPSTTAPFVGTLLPQCHNPGVKTFLGQTGNFAMSDILDIIFRQEAGYTVAYFICNEIYMNFVYWVPNAGVVAAMANLLVQSDWELAPVMRALFSSAHFYDPSIIGGHLKSPVEYVGSMIREFEITYPKFDGSDPQVVGKDSNGYNLYSDPNVSLTFLSETVGVDLGQEILNPPNVKGWPVGPDWVTVQYYQSRHVHSSNLLAYPVFYDGTDAVGKVYLDFEADNWLNSWPNAANTLITPLAVEIDAHIMGLPPGPIETTALYDTVNALLLPDDEWHPSKDYGSTYAVTLALYPEFQLI